MNKEISIFEIRRHPLMSAILIGVGLSLLYTLYLALMPHAPFEYVVTRTIWGEGLYRWQVMHPVWSYLFIGVATAFVSIKLGQLSSRFNLYGTNTYLSIEIYPLIIMGGVVNMGSVRMSIVSILIYYSLSRFFSSYRATNSAGLLSSGAMALGLSTLLYPPAILLWGVVPLVVIIFERTLREVIVAFISLLIVPFSYLYIIWFQGGSITEEINHFADQLLTPNDYSILDSLSWSTIAMLALMLYLFVGAFLAIPKLENTVKARRRLKVAMTYSIATALMFAIPSADTSVFGLLAVPVALMIPSTFVTHSRIFSFILYILLFVLTAVGAIC